MCTLWADGYAGQAQHLAQQLNFGVVVAGDLVEFRAYARERGWSGLRLLSSGGTSFKRDLGIEGEDGSQMPGGSVFVRDEKQRLRHFYSGCAIFGDGHFRGMDLLCAVWNFLDLTPQGRGDWMPRLGYGSEGS